MSTIIPTRPTVFVDVQGGSEFFGRIIIELFTDKTPRTAENFRAICAPPAPAAEALTYKGSPFHRIIDEFMIQGGDITAGNGTGGMSVYGPAFEDENIGWRKIDAAGLVCMANRGKDTNSSQFFITLAPCEHLNGKHTIFGHVVKGMDVCERMAKVPVDKKDSPLFEVIVSQCGELERKSNPNTAPHGLVREINGEHRRTQEKGERQAKQAADTANHPHHIVEGAIPGLMRTAVAGLLPDPCLRMMTPHDRRPENVSIADAARLRHALRLQNDPGHPI
ncbi:MAG: hypothetical protein Q9182_003027 [Xanthomendoza sp. 2 TL-2023]